VKARERRLSETLRIVDEIQRLLAKVRELESGKLSWRERRELQRLRAQLCVLAKHLEKQEVKLAAL